jgi:hypothetical protein
MARAKTIKDAIAAHSSRAATISPNAEQVNNADTQSERRSTDS